MCGIFNTQHSGHHVSQGVLGEAAITPNIQGIRNGRLCWEQMRGCPVPITLGL